MDAENLENLDSKAEFRKPSNESASRKYRRRSSVGGSSSSDGSQRGHSPSPIHARKHTGKHLDDKLRKGDGRELDRDYRRSNRGGDVLKYSDRQFSRSSHRHDDHRKVDKRSDDYDLKTFRSSRDSHDAHGSHYSRSNKDCYRSKDCLNDADKYCRETYDRFGHKSRDGKSSDRDGSWRRHSNYEDWGKDEERERHREVRGFEDDKKVNQKSSGDHKNNFPPIHDGLESKRKDTIKGENYAHGLNENLQSICVELDGESANETKKEQDTRGSFMEQCSAKPDMHAISDITGSFSCKSPDSVAKKPKLSSLDCSISGSEGNSGQLYVTDSDIDAAKTAAMKAAELVNKNLVGTGFMSADQKKKLLWGNKSNNNAKESTHRWETTNFGDRERQEKFNKLMSLRLHWYLWPIVGCERQCKGGESTRQPRCREAEGKSSVGIGKAIHGWITSEGWPDCWAWSLKVFVSYLHLCSHVRHRTSIIIKYFGL